MYTLTDIMNKLDFDSDSVNFLADTARKLFKKDRAFFESTINEYMCEDADIVAIGERIAVLAETRDINKYTVWLVFLVLALQPLLEKYQKAGLSQELFFDTMQDLKFKLDECKKVYGVCGVFTWGWFHWFYLLKRFKLGRFQYEIKQFKGDIFVKNGNCIKISEDIINIHIPSNGISLTDEIRLDSYKKAYEYFKPIFKKEILPFMCHTWLFYEGNERILPPTSNILRFKHDFCIVESEAVPNSGDLWRVFGTAELNPYQNLPESTSIQKSIKKHLLCGGNIGSGFGIMFFDGEKIL